MLQYPSIDCRSNVAAFYPFSLCCRSCPCLSRPSHLLFTTIADSCARNICRIWMPRNLGPKRPSSSSGVWQFVHPCFPIKADSGRIAISPSGIWDGMEGICNCASASEGQPPPPELSSHKPNGRLASLKLNPAFSLVRPRPPGHLNGVSAIILPGASAKEKQTARSTARSPAPPPPEMFSP